MTNREKFKEVFNAYIDGIDCMEEWLNSEYIEPQEREAEDGR